MLHGSGNLVSLVNGWESVNALDGGNTIKTGGGRDSIIIGGSGNFVDAGEGQGRDSVRDLGHDNVIVIPRAGQGYQDIAGDVLSNGDLLDVRAALGATTWDHNMATLGNYVSLRFVADPHLAELMIHSTGTSAAVGVTTIIGNNALPTDNLLQHLKVS